MLFCEKGFGVLVAVLFWFISIVACAGDEVIVGKIRYNSSELLGHGSEGTLVFK